MEKSRDFERVQEGIQLSRKEKNDTDTCTIVDYLTLK